MDKYCLGKGSEIQKRVLRKSDDLKTGNRKVSRSQIFWSKKMAAKKVVAATAMASTAIAGYVYVNKYVEKKNIFHLKSFTQKCCRDAMKKEVDEDISISKEDQEVANTTMEGNTRTMKKEEVDTNKKEQGVSSRGALKETVDEVREAVKEKMEDVKEAVEGSFVDIKEKVVGAKEAVKEKVVEVKEKVVAVEEKVVEVKEAVEEKVVEVKEAVEESFEDIKERVEDVVDSAKENISNVVKTGEEANSGVLVVLAMLGSLGSVYLALRGGDDVPGAVLLGAVGGDNGSDFVFFMSFLQVSLSSLPSAASKTSRRR